ncbi:hypothetical protein AX774_g4538 [Zancudomyces culisetae]|uniref:Uncharacterized protein n=1 Tax=Zancudomyces culisetae TaxID=1213189 RepID=A0A1R1PM43_ZANCU|nr:hypothetical protein AX774_g4538 [Zancudomyces culisetae]|eukprot:OMH82003.1 hypothetical protein AX774_g4538 [Zancudomyces culisetae]
MCVRDKVQTPISSVNAEAQLIGIMFAFYKCLNTRDYLDEDDEWVYYLSELVSWFVLFEEKSNLIESLDARNCIYYTLKLFRRAILHEPSVHLVCRTILDH